MKFFINFLFLILFLEMFGELVIAAAGSGGRRARGNCPTLTLKGGRVKIRSRGRIARFRCRRQYTLYGSKMAVCIGKKWSHKPPVCLVARCPDVDVADNVQMTVDPKYKGALLQFACEDGMVLEGVDVLYCDGTSWNADPPRCLHTEVDRQCDFESSDLCGWTQDNQDNFDWIWHTGTTATARTGPKHDHTLAYLNDTNGHYLYIETSSPRRPNDVARLYSPMYNSIDAGFCFSLWYHMLGPDIQNQVGSLDIYILPAGQSLIMVQPIFHIEGNKGDFWLKARAEVDAVNSSFQVVIAATRKNSYVSDIAIDDVRLYNCSEDITQDTTLSETTYGIEETTYELPETTQNEVIVTEGNPSTQIVTTSTEGLGLPSVDNTQQLETTSYVITTGPSSILTSLAVVSTESIMPEETTTMRPEPEPHVETTSKITDKSTTLKITTTPAQHTTTFSLPTTAKQLTTVSTFKDMSSTPVATTQMTTISTIEDTTSSTSEKFTTKLEGVSTKLSTSAIKSSIVTELKTKEFLTTDKMIPSMPSETKVSTKEVITKTTSSKERDPFETTKWDDSENAIDSTRRVPVRNDNSTDNNNNNNNNITTTTDLPNVIRIGRQRAEDGLPTKPLLIGIGVGVAVGLLIVVIVIFVWIKRKRRKEAEFFEDEMAPIAKNACNEW